VARETPGDLAIVLHTHMPYVEGGGRWPPTDVAAYMEEHGVDFATALKNTPNLRNSEGFGTWPFGEEWLWEAMATSYLPLLDLLDGEAPLTLSVTPVLADQLSAQGVGERFLAFLRDVRAKTHRVDIDGCRAGGEHVLATELERAAEDYERADGRFEKIGGNLLGALAPHVQWTSSATHAVLPLLATDAGARLQIQAGIDSHRARFKAPWRGGFWLPECAHAEWLDPLLEEAGVHATCVDLTDVLGLGSPSQLAPLRSEAGPVLMPIDRVTMELVWSPDGYPAHGTYRDYHRRTTHDHRPWGNDGRPYAHAAAIAQARAHAADFVARTRERLARAAPELDQPALAVCALDTELLGHWWYEGVSWLGFVLSEAEHQGLQIRRLDDALAERDAVPAPADIGVTSWGSPRDLSTWDGPQVAELAWRARAAELAVLRAPRDRAEQSLHALLALQASDWAFMISRSLAGPYPRERSDGHFESVQAGLAAVGSAPGGLHNLAPHASIAPLLVP
jgi:1,4-alpha-glucan branching enzyme